MMKLLSLIILCFSSITVAEQFQAPVTNTQWQVIESPLECSLIQEIEGYGNARFTQRSGEELSLIFTTKTQPAIQAMAYFEIAQAPWQNSEQRQNLLSIRTKKNQSQFILSGDLAQQALTHIREGRFPTLRYQSQSSADDISVLFSTIHLSDSMPAFEQCLENLYPDTFNDIQKLTVYFSLEDAGLSPQAQASLTRLADYVKIDDSVRQITISGHTDNHGRKRLNVPLSEARAIAVKQYFIKQCELEESMIRTSFHREFNPSQSNKSQTGRAHNRRAEIEVIR